MAERQAPPPKTAGERSAEALEAIAHYAGRIVAALERLSPPPKGVEVDLDGKYGDPQVRFDPRGWTGPSMRGRAFSRTSSEFLDFLVPVLDYFASVEASPKLARMKRADAERARGWAERLRAGGTTGGRSASASGARPGAAAGPPRAAPPAAAPPPARGLPPSPAARAPAPSPPVGYPASWDDVEEPVEDLEELPPEA